MIPDGQVKELSALIRASRELKGIPRTTFAKMAGISPNSMVKYELSILEDGKVPGAENLARICQLLEIDPRDAFDALDQSGRLKNKGKEAPFAAFAEPFGFAEFFSDKDVCHGPRLSGEDVGSIFDNFDALQHDMRLLHERLDRMENKENGPGENPSRPMKTNNQEAVDAASTKHAEGSER